MIKSYPRAFWVLWFVELWERFGFYGVQAILVIYMANILGFSEKESLLIFGSFISYTFGLSVLGGVIGDRYIGAKRSVFIGIIILSMGYAFLSISTKETISYALTLIILGNGFFKANNNSLVSKIFDSPDKMDSAFTMYYAAINLGSLFSMFATPIIAKYVSWKIAFLVCSIGLLIGLINFVVFYKYIKNLSTVAGKTKVPLSSYLLTIIGSVIIFIIISMTLKNSLISSIIICSITSIAIGYYFFLVKQESEINRGKMMTAFYLLMIAVIFLVLYFQMPTSLTFFAVHNVDNNIFGVLIPPAEYQLLNPFFILLMAPLLSYIYIKIKTTYSTKFIVGLLFCSIAFLSLYLSQFFSHSGLISPYWMVITYFFQSTGELLIGALGLSVVASLCPKEHSGFVMGFWYIMYMISGTLAARLASIATPQDVEKLSSEQTLSIYTNLFFSIGVFTLLITLLVFLLRRKINKGVS